jgi:protein-disulfide isomerase
MDDTKTPFDSENVEEKPARSDFQRQTSANLPAAKRVLRRPPARSNALTLWLALPFAFLVGLFSGWLLWGLSASSAKNTQVTVDENVKRYTVSADDDPFLGPQDAPITIVEFSDYQCPYCTKWYQEVHSRLMKDYAGKVRFIYRDFPLYSIHPEAQSAAEAANCAGEQGAYWQFHDVLFGQNSELGVPAYTKYAAALGLNTSQFDQCVSDRKYKSEVEADYKYASSLGVSSTPTFFVNGLAVVGAQPYEVFQQIIDKELAGEIPK